MSHYCYFNGQIMPEHEIRFQVNDLGILRSYSVFDYMRTYNFTPFRLTDYLIRFENSVKSFDMDMPISKEEIAEKIEELIFWRRDKTQDVGIRLLMTGGHSLDGYNPPEMPNLLIRIEDLHPKPAHYYENGVKVIIHEYQRELPEVKSTNYSRALIKQKAMTEKKAVDALYHLDGKISECTRNNFFIFKDNTLITPRKDILKGITRKTVLELAATKFQVEERDIYLEELKEATEAFSTGSNTNVLPIIQLDELKINKQVVGTNTRALIQMFADFTHESTLAN